MTSSPLEVLKQIFIRVPDYYKLRWFKGNVGVHSGLEVRKSTNDYGNYLNLHFINM